MGNRLFDKRNHINQAQPLGKQLSSKQSGTVLITVVLIAAFVIVLVVEAIKMVKFQKQLSSNLINRDQAYSYLMGMEELAKVLLKRAFEAEKSETVHLNQLWAQDNITFPLDNGMMTASIKDMQSCFNLNTVAKIDEPPGSEPGKKGDSQKDNSAVRPIPATGPNGMPVSTHGQEMLEAIITQTFEQTDIQPDELAISVRDWIDADIDPVDHRGAEDDYYQVLDVPYRAPNDLIAHLTELLTIKGFNRKSVDALKPLVCVLPTEDSKININTVTADNAILIKAALGTRGITLSDVKKVINDRPEEGFNSVADFIVQIPKAEGSAGFENWLDVTSNYFLVDAQAEIGSSRVAMKTLFERDERNNFKVISRYFGRE